VLTELQEASASHFKKADLRQYCRRNVRENGKFVILSDVHYVPPDGNKFTDQKIDNIVDPDKHQYDNALFEVELYGAAATLKHDSFQEEKEWRMLLLQQGRTLKHRIRGSVLVPYIELDLGSALGGLLAFVIVGPTSHKEQTAEAIRGMLVQADLSSVEVRCSSIPYRGF
jgi:Protein of unknown function (DUF2971)